MYRIELSKEANKALDAMPRDLCNLIAGKLSFVAQDPYAANNNVKALRGRPGYSLRVGDYRVLFQVETEIRVLLVERVGPRGSVYQ